MAQIKALLEGLSWRQRISIGLAAVLVSLGLWLGVKWNRDKDLKPLFTNLSAEDSGLLVAKIKTSNVPYRVSDDGTILVPSAKVAELRLELASAGLPRSGRIGFELFDKTNFGATDFTQQVNYRRAVEGELERSVMALGEVEKARVHVTFAKDSVFVESREPAKASVMVKLQPGAKLSAQHIQGITHLAASAVEGLEPENVSVLDMHGALLNRPRKNLADEPAGASDARLEFRQSIEKDLVQKIRATLDPLLGEGKYRAGVTADIDFSSGEQSEETFDPDKSVMTSSQKTEDVSSTSTNSGGVPGTNSNLPKPSERTVGSKGGVARRTESVNYQTSRVVKRMTLPQGTMKRLSVAILLDQELKWEGSGPQAKRVVEPPSPERLKVVKDVVAGVVGFQETRGDQILVETLPFEATLTSAPPETTPAALPVAAPAWAIPLPSWAANWFQQPPSAVWIGAAAAIGVVLLVGLYWVIRSLLKRRKKPAPIAVAAPALPVVRSGIPIEEQAMAQLAANDEMQERLEQEMLASLKLPPTTKKTEVLKRKISETASKEPVAAAQILRTWLGDVER